VVETQRRRRLADARARDALLAQWQPGELLYLEAAEQRVRWRLALGERADFEAALEIVDTVIARTSLPRFLVYRAEIAARLDRRDSRGSRCTRSPTEPSRAPPAVAQRALALARSSASRRCPRSAPGSSSSRAAAARGIVREGRREHRELACRHGTPSGAGAGPPEITELPGGVLRMELPIRLPGLGHVNCYAIPTTAAPRSSIPGCPVRALEGAADAPRAGRSRRARRAHRDRHPLAPGPLRRRGALRARGRRGDRRAPPVLVRPFPTTTEPEVSVDDLAAHHRHAHGDPGDPTSDLPETLQAAIDDAQTILERARSSGRTPWGGTRPRPPFWTRMRFRAAHWLGRSFIPAISKPVEHGDVLTLGGREWFVTHTPGHTGDHICLHDPSRACCSRAITCCRRSHRTSAASAARPIRSRRSSTASTASRDPGHLAGAARARPSVRRSRRAHARDQAPSRERLARVREISRELGRARDRCRRSRSGCSTRAAGVRWPRARPTRTSSICASPGDAERRAERDGTLLYVAG
jgi:hypothetical protein